MPSLCGAVAGPAEFRKFLDERFYFANPVRPGVFLLLASSLFLISTVFSYASLVTPSVPPRTIASSHQWWPSALPVHSPPRFSRLLPTLGQKLLLCASSFADQRAQRLSGRSPYSLSHITILLFLSASWLRSALCRSCGLSRRRSGSRLQ